MASILTPREGFNIAIDISQERERASRGAQVMPLEVRACGRAGEEREERSAGQ